MSIAVSALIKPSRWLFRLVRAMVAIRVVAVWLLLVFPGTDDMPAYGGWILSTLSCAALVACCWYWERKQHTKQILISAKGEIRLMLPGGDDHLTGDEENNLWTLLPASTLWPHLLILHLRDGSGHRQVLVILRDSVSSEAFQALLVAGRWLAGNTSRASTSHMGQN